MSKISTAKTEDISTAPQKECPCICVGFAEGAVGVKSLTVKSKSSAEIIDFGEVLPGSETIRCVDLKNFLDQPVSYYIHRMSYVNGIYQSFHFNKYNMTINPRATLQLKITYCPLLENEKSSDLFWLSTRDSTEVEKVRLVGKCLGTKIKCSTKTLQFIWTPSVKKRVNTFELRNVSRVPATFQFDVNENEEFFEVDIVNGQIQPKKSIYITVTFNGKVEGVHYKRLVVLIYKHDPIMIDLLGVYSRSKQYSDHFPSLTMYPCESQSMFGAYFNDYGFSEEKILPFQFNQNCFDFGRMLPQNYGKDRNKNIAVAILKNNMVHDISIKWYKDPDKIFSILPEELNVKADETGYFELSFHPDFKDHLYSRKMSAQIHWRNTPRPNTPIANSSGEMEGDEHVPLETNIILIGHSFPENQSWISAVEIIPPKIIFPVCIPGYQSYATFMLKSDGHLPVLFKFLPPRKSSITVKPMMGMMRFTKLLVAKLQTHTTPTVYKEEWRIEINGESQKTCGITFLGQSDVPSVVIGHENTITFNTTLPGCQDIVTVPVKNTSCYHLRLDLIELNEYFHAKPSYLELHPNEETVTEWTFNAKLDVPNETEIQCSTRVISNLEEIIGLPFDVQVKLYAQSEYSQICATPRYQDFGEIPWGEIRYVKFKIFNFGKSAVAYTLKALTVTGNHDEIRISNVMGKLKPNDNSTVNVSFRTQTTGEHVAQIVYCTRINSFGEVLASNHPVDLFSMKYICIHPALQIEECVEHTLGRMFSKLDMWNFFSVNRINEELTNVKEGETRTINLLLPTIICHETEYRVRFVLRNITTFDLTACLSRVKICECQPTEISKSLSFRQKVFQCPHRKMVTMKLSCETIHGLSYQFLDIFMNFNLTTTEQVAYDFKMGKDRHLKFCFQMNNIPPDVSKLSLYNNQKHKKFLNMFIGAKEPPYQSLWLYNCTSQESSFEVIDNDLFVLNEIEGFPVLTCLNTKGIVPPYSSRAIFFRFHPIEAKKYQVAVPLILGNERTSIKLTGRGIYKYDNNLIHNFNNTLPTTSLQVGDFPITLSSDFIVVEPFSVWNCMERMIYMRNITKDKVMEFTWQKCLIEGIIEVNANPSTGTIQPDSVIAIVLKFKSFEIPAISTINMLCKIIDLTQNLIHSKSVEKYQERQKEVDEFFTIDEKGTHTVKNDYVIEPAPEEKYMMIAITFHTISNLELLHYLDVEQFFNRNPFEDFDAETVDLSKSDISYNQPVSNTLECNPAVSNTLECLIMDTLRSPVFQERLHFQQDATPPYYIQFKQEEEKTKAKSRKARTKEMNKYFTKSPLVDLSDTFKSLIKDSVQQIFF